MCVIKYFFYLLFLTVLCSQALQFPLLRSCQSRCAPSGMEYFGSVVLLAVVSSFLLMLVDSPKIIGPLLFPFMMTSVVPILMMSPSVILLEAIDICPTARLVGLCGRVVQQSCWACAW
jgi:hypothetical protein